MHTTNRRDDPHRQAKGEQLGGRPIQMVTVLLIVIVIGLHHVAAQIPSRESVRRGHELVPAPAWFKSICQRHPDSPWSRAAMEFSATNQALYARFDLNKDWIPAYFDVGGPLGLVRLRFQVDANKDSHLDAYEFKNVISEVRRLTEQRRKRQPMGSLPE